MELKLITAFLALFLVNTVECHRDHHGHGQGPPPPGGRPNPLPHFRKDEFSSNFALYKIPDTCSTASKHCIKAIHDHAVKCERMLRGERAAELRECMVDQEIAEANREWQIASSAYHLAVDDCLKGQHAPARTGDAFLLFRRKRETTAQECAEESMHDVGTYESARECWEDLVEHRRKCGACMAQDRGCDLVATCMGKGRRPDDPELGRWFDRNHRLNRAKTRKVKQAKRKLMTCMGLSHSSVRLFE